jgi:hypothetical protein
MVYTSTRPTVSNTQNTSKRIPSHPNKPLQLLTTHTEKLKYIFQKTSFYKYRLKDYTHTLLDLVPQNQINEILPKAWQNVPLLTEKQIEHYSKLLRELGVLMQWWEKEKNSDAPSQRNSQYFETIAQEKAIWNNFQKLPSIEGISQLYKNYCKMIQLFGMSADKEFEYFIQRISSWLSKTESSFQHSINKAFTYQEKIKLLSKECIDLGKQIEKAEVEYKAKLSKKQKSLEALQSTLENKLSAQSSDLPKTTRHLLLFHIKTLSHLIISKTAVKGTESRALQIKNIHIDNLEQTIFLAIEKILDKQEDKYPQELKQYSDAVKAISSQEERLEELYTQVAESEVQKLDTQENQIMQLGELENLILPFWQNKTIMGLFFSSNDEVKKLLIELNSQYTHLKHLIENTTYYMHAVEFYKFKLMPSASSFERDVEYSPLHYTVDYNLLYQHEKIFTTHQTQLEQLIHWWNQSQFIIEQIAIHYPDTAKWQKAVHSFQTISAIHRNWTSIHVYLSPSMYQITFDKEYYTLLEQLKMHHTMVGELFPKVKNDAQSLIDTVESFIRTHCFNQISKTPANQLSCVLYNYFLASSSKSTDHNNAPNAIEQFYYKKLDDLIKQYLYDRSITLTPDEKNFFRLVKSWKVFAHQTTAPTTQPYYTKKVKEYMERGLHTNQRILLDEINQLNQDMTTSKTNHHGTFFKQNADCNLQRKAKLSLIIP